jgi:hypothetical protein
VVSEVDCVGIERIGNEGGHYLAFPWGNLTLPRTWGQTVPDRNSTMSLTNSDRPPNKGQNPNYPKNGHAEHPQELGVADIKEDRQRQGIGTSQARTPPDQATG